MWNYKKEVLTENMIHRYQIDQDGELITYVQFLDLLTSHSIFRSFYNGILADSEFQAYFWENKAMEEHNQNKPYEFVLVNSPYLNSLEADSNDFSEYFNTEEMVVTFPNLGKNALLVVPTPNGKASNYTHLASFVRNASKEQIDDFWKLAAVSYQKEIRYGKKWLSTCGAGVSWLHLRIDDKPKYYRFKDYC